MTNLQPLAYSYVRFSDPSQAAGDSIRRQTKLAAEWTKRNDVKLDTSLTLLDAGRSAFHGKHRSDPEKAALAAFLQLVESGRIPRGSILLIENMDRLSREKPVVGVNLMTSILLMGIRIVQLAPDELELTEDSDLFALFRGQMSQARGHDESKMKSSRLAAKWDERRRIARAGGVMTRKLPAWVQEKNGKLHLIPERAAVVRRIFALAGTGHGLYSIMRRLMEENVPAFGKQLVQEGKQRSAFCGRWSVSYINTILRDRRAVGEFQPRIGGKPDGDPITNYFPRVVSEEAWEQARLGAAERFRKPGRIGGGVNIFAGLLRDARNGESYTCSFTTSERNPHQLLISTAPRSGAGTGNSFRLDVFEDAVLSELWELDQRELMGQEEGPDELAVLSGQLARVEASIEAITAEMDEHGESPALFKRLRAKEAQQRELAPKVAIARQQAEHPLSESWGEVKSMLEPAGPLRRSKEGRLKLRAALRRIIDEMRVIVVRRGLSRLCVVQIYFKGTDAYRHYLIFQRPTHATATTRTEEAWAVRSHNYPEDGIQLHFGEDADRMSDLRNKDGVSCWTRTLEDYPQWSIDQALQQQ